MKRLKQNEKKLVSVFWTNELKNKKGKTMINTGKKHLVHIVKYRWWWMLLTTILLVPGIIAMIYSSVTYANHAPLKVGIDYTGGTILQYGLEQKLNNSDVTKTREKLEK